MSDVWFHLQNVLETHTVMSAPVELAPRVNQLTLWSTYKVMGFKRQIISVGMSFIATSAAKVTKSQKFY